MKHKLTTVFVIVCAIILLTLGSLVQAAGEDGTRDAITPTPMAVTGITVSLSAASGDGHSFLNTGDTFVMITNSYTDTITPTFVTPGQVGGLNIEDVSVAISAGQTKLIGPFAIGLFNQPSGSDKNRVYLNWNATVTGTVANSVTLAVFDQ